MARYEVTEQTANLLDALKELDEAYERFSVEVCKVYGEGTEETGKRFFDKFSELRDEAERLILDAMMDNFSLKGSRVL